MCSSHKCPAEVAGAALRGEAGRLLSGSIPSFWNVTSFRMIKTAEKRSNREELRMETMQLKVGLKLGVVAAELALVDVANHAAPLLFGQRALGVDVGVENLQAVRGVAVAHGTLVEAQSYVNASSSYALLETVKIPRLCHTWGTPPHYLGSLPLPQGYQVSLEFQAYWDFLGPGLSSSLRNIIMSRGWEDGDDPSCPARASLVESLLLSRSLVAARAVDRQLFSISSFSYAGREEKEKAYKRFFVLADALDDGRYMLVAQQLLLLIIQGHTVVMDSMCHKGTAVAKRQLAQKTHQHRLPPPIGHTALKLGQVHIVRDIFGHTGVFGCTIRLQIVFVVLVAEVIDTKTVQHGTSARQPSS
ncbi:hypothetical protein EYF80_005037 [Liparis tanakae]|uniref:Uncharacterized protein n=1 Tax=Liparis tanakae TaxID=230148 RepID=A0A4Z2J562_9TELE|nr:hypothetical protein EYF80_005037 [Liparis tanakae]